MYVFSRVRKAGTTPFQVTSISEQTKSFTQAAAEPRGLTEPGGPGQTGKAAFFVVVLLSRILDTMAQPKQAKHRAGLDSRTTFCGGFPLYFH